MFSGFQSPTTENSLDQTGIPSAAFIPTLTDVVTTSCSVENVVSGSGQGCLTPNNCMNVQNCQPSPTRINSVASLSDSSSEVPNSMATGCLAPSGINNPVSTPSAMSVTGRPTTSSVIMGTPCPHPPQAQTLTASANPNNSNCCSIHSGSTPMATNSGSCPCLRTNVAIQTDDSLLSVVLADPGDEPSALGTSPIKSNLSPFTSGPVSPNPQSSMAATIENLQRHISELEREAALHRENLIKMQENAQRSREVIRELLIEKSVLERKTTRQKVMENRLRLGQFVTQRQGAHFEEKWIEGSRFKELDQRRKNIELVREEIERKKKQWNKRKPSLGDGKKNSKSRGDEVSVDEFYEQLEIYDLRKQMLVKEDKEIQMELERLDRERNLHIREIKRIANEDASRFKDHPLLNDRYLLLNLLGKGGFSEVHKGFDLVANRYVACKVHQLNPAWPKDKKDNYIKHALREINIHKTLNHPRIVKVFDVFDIDHDA
ncbi:TLK1 [Fasciolopsis buskii]|uniref:TLK1 n=1 Tax=Fasciolopsis buskii TaxID=27845 RepID=A0A8E0VFH2_9TREM|nr:TLK1 [Fasciolopsis buski]